jgi:Tol biopolymer transport system component
MAGLHAKFAGSDVDLLASEDHVLVSTIAFSSTRDDPANIPLLTGEIYLMKPDGTNARRVTVDGTYADFFPALSPDGKKSCSRAIDFELRKNRSTLQICS